MSVEFDEFEFGKIILFVVGFFGELSVFQDLDSYVVIDRLVIFDVNLFVRLVISCFEDLMIFGLFVKDVEQE